MKIQYPTEYASRKISLEREETLEEIVKTMDCDFAAANVDVMGTTLFRLFVYPSPAKEFTKGQIAILRRLFESTFGFKSGKIHESDRESKYNWNKYKWVRDLRDNEGTFHQTRMINKFYEDPIGDLFILLECAPNNGCTVTKKERTVTYYESDCADKKIIR